MATLDGVSDFGVQFMRQTDRQTDRQADIDTEILLHFGTYIKKTQSRYM